MVRPASVAREPQSRRGFQTSFRRPLLTEGNLEDAERRYQAALALDEQVVARHPDNASYRYDLTFSLTDLALIAKRRREFAQAESLWTRALAIRQAALAADPRNTRAKAGVANIHAYLGGLYFTQKRIDEAIDRQREHVRLRNELVAEAGPLPSNVGMRAEAQVYLIRALVDRAETERREHARAVWVSEARQLLRLIEPVARTAEENRLPNAAYLVSGSDIWALGVVLYEMVAGRRPFGGATSFEVTSAILRDEPPRLPSRVTSAFRAVVDRCLAKEPGARFQHAALVGGAYAWFTEGFDTVDLREAKAFLAE